MLFLIIFSMQKIGYRLFVGAFVLVLVGAGCSSTTPAGNTDTVGDSTSGTSEVASGGNCGALKITADGKDITSEYSHGIAYTSVNMGYRTDMVDLFNHSEVTCADVLPKYRPTSIPTDEVIARAFFGAYPGVSISGYTELPMTSDITVSKQPSGAGDTMTICVNDPIEFTATAGTYSGQKVSMSGSFSGEYCGDKTEN